MILNGKQQRDVLETINHLYTSVTSLRWVGAGPTVELKSLENQYETVHQRLESVRVKLSELVNVENP